MKDRKFIIGLLLAVFTLIDLVAVVGFQISRFSVQEGRMKKLRSDIENAQREWTLHESLLKEKSELETELASMQNRFLSKDDVSYLLSEVNRASKRHKIELLSTKLLQSETIGGSGGITFYYLPVIVSMDTDFHRFARFANYLELQAVPIRIKKIMMSGVAPRLQVDAEFIGVGREE